MADHRLTMAENENELLDYEDADEEETAEQTIAADAAAPAKKDVKGTYVSIHSSGFRDFLLKPEILRAIVECGFEHPSEGECRLPGGGGGDERGPWRRTCYEPVGVV